MKERKLLIEQLKEYREHFSMTFDATYHLDLLIQDFEREEEEFNEGIE